MEKEKTTAPTENRFLGRAALSLVVIPTEPSCLPFSIQHDVSSTGKLQMFYTEGLSDKMQPDIPQVCPSEGKRLKPANHAAKYFLCPHVALYATCSAMLAFQCVPGTYRYCGRFL
jgi:hypothetical protein